jgi:peptidoglycan/xylan/chitin deacetylase (PgdA/CDA1 family)
VVGDHGVPVLMYHRVDLQLSARDPITVDLTVSQSAFEAQLQALRAAGYRSMSLEMLLTALDGGAVPARRVVLTFDDGYEDHFATVFPLLRKYGFTGTFFVVTSSVGTRDHLTVDQIRQMAEAGMEIGSHGVHHVDFSRLPLPAARAELVQSRATLETWTGRRVVFFAYPAGRYSAALEGLLNTLGYQGALTERPGFVTTNSPRYLLERLRVSHDDSGESFARKVRLPTP